MPTSISINVEDNDLIKLMELFIISVNGFLYILEKKQNLTNCVI